MTCSSSTICRPDRLRAVAARALVALAALSLASPASLGVAAASDDAGDLIMEANRFLSRGDGIAAEVRLRQALDKGARQIAVAAAMGEALIDQGRPDLARQWLQAGEFTPASAARGFRALARLERLQGDPHAASRAYDRALAITPNDAELWVEISRLRYAGGDHLLAIQAADHALSLDRENVRALELRGQLVRDRDGLVPSLVWFKEAHERAPDDISVLGEYAATLGDAGETVRMLAMTRRMLEIDPGNPRAYYLQAVMAARAGRYELARTLLMRTDGRLANQPAVMLLEGVLEIAAKNYTLAAEALEPLLKLQPGNERARDLLARALFLAGDYPYLVERFGDRAAQRDASPYLQILVARAYENLDRRADAAPLLESAASVNQPNIHAVGEGTSVGELLEQGRIGEAENLAGQWVARNPGYFDHLTQAGDVQLATGNPRSALEYYAQAARIRMSERLMERCAEAMAMIGESRRAAGLAEAYLAKNPTSTGALRLSGRMAASSGDWQRARYRFEQLRFMEGGNDVRLLTDLSIAQLRTGDPAAAEATAREAYRLQRSNPLAAQAWGLSLAALGKRKAAAQALLAKARAMMGDTPLLAEARARLASSAQG